MKRVYVAGHRLPASEAVVLEALLDAERPLLVSEVQRRLAGRRWAHTTVSTLLGRLVDRGLVIREPEGRAHRYRSSGSAGELAAAALERALEGVDDPAGALLAFIDRLPAPTRRRLARRLRGAKGR